MIFAAVALVAPLAINAASITSTNTLSSGGLNFSNFGCSISSDGGNNSTPNTCSQINVSTLSNPSGIQFSSGFEATRGAFEDADLSYSVTSTVGAITSVGLYFNGTFEGLAVTQVTETVFAPGSNNALATLTVTCSAAAGCPDQTENIALNGSYTSLNIQKDIDLSANSRGTAAGSIVDQTFSTAAPEPASLALMGAGLLVAGAFRRKIVKG